MEIKTYKVLFDITKQMYYAGFIYGVPIFDDNDGIDIEKYTMKTFEEKELLRKMNLIVIEKVYHIG